MITIVAGASGALGSGVARDLAKRGHRVVAVGIPSTLRALNDLVGELGGGALALAFDGSVEAWDEAVAHVEADVGPVGGAVLAAGGWRGGAPLWEGNAHLGAMLEMNVDTVHQPLRALLARMVPRKAGSIVIVGSRAAVRPETSKGAAAYAASKAAVVALAEAAAAEANDAGVRVNAILPSTIDTPANRKAMPDVDPSRWVSIPSLAGVIAFLLSEESRDVSGAAIPVYGRA